MGSSSFKFGFYIETFVFYMKENYWNLKISLKSNQFGLYNETLGFNIKLWASKWKRVFEKIMCSWASKWKKIKGIYKLHVQLGYIMKFFLDFKMKLWALYWKESSGIWKCFLQLGVIMKLFWILKWNFGLYNEKRVVEFQVQLGFKIESNWAL